MGLNNLELANEPAFGAFNYAMISHEHVQNLLLDGEPIGILPAVFQLFPNALNVII